MSTFDTMANPAPGLDDRARQGNRFGRALLTSRATYIFLLDIVLIIVFSILVGPSIFLSTANAQAMLLAGTQALILALGLAMMLGAGAFDLSLGANLVLSSVVGALVVKSIAAPAPEGGYANVAAGLTAGVIACLVTGAIFGAVNGVLIAYFNMNSLIATLGTLGIGTGIALVLSGGGDLVGLPPDLQSGFGLAKFLTIPVPAIIALLLAAILAWVVMSTRYGLRTLAIGSSRSAAERTGIRVRPHLLSLAVLAGTLAGFAGFLDLATFGATSINGHANAALAAATAVVIGGTLIEGGRISIIGTVWGAALAVILQTGLVLVNVSSAYQLIAVGVVLILAIGLDRLTILRRARS